MTQNTMIIDLLRDGWLDPIRAFVEVGTLKLATRISEIRASGIKVEERIVPYVNRSGKHVYYKEYRIKEAK